MKKKLLFLVLAFVAGFSFLIGNVKADEYTVDLASTVTFYNKNLNADVTKFPGISNTFFKYVWDASRGHTGVAYCIIAGRNNPAHGSNVYRKSEIDEPELIYILQHGYSHLNGQVSMGELGNYSEDQAYYITQLAVWMHLGPSRGGYDPNKFKDTTNDLAARAYKLYSDSRGAGRATANPYIKNAVGSYELHYDAANKRYITDPMHITGYNISKYTVALSNAPAGTKLIKADGSEFASGSTFDFKSNEDSQANGVYYIVVPESSVTGSNEISMTLSVSASTYILKAFLYESSTPNLQPLAILIPVNYTVSDVQQYKIKPNNESCETLVQQLLRDFSEKQRTRFNTTYMAKINDAKKKYKEFNTDAGVEKPRCAPPTCEEVIAYLNVLRTENNNDKPTAEFLEELNRLKDKYGINSDAGYDHLSCKRPSCEEVVDYLKKKYTDRSANNADYVKELNSLKEKYGIYTDQGIENPSCEPAPGKPSCKEKLDELLKKYPNPADRNQNNSSYVKDVDEIIAIGQQYGWKLYTDDYANPDCVPHYKKEVRIRKVIQGTDTDLAGATLVLTTEDGVKVAEWVTDGTAKVFTDLNPGKYIITETVAPAGYNLGASITFEITAGQEEYSLDFKIEDGRIPDTADINFTLIITAFILFLGFGIFGLIKTSQKEDM